MIRKSIMFLLLCVCFLGVAWPTHHSLTTPRSLSQGAIENLANQIIDRSLPAEYLFDMNISGDDIIRIFKQAGQKEGVEIRDDELNVMISELQSDVPKWNTLVFHEGTDPTLMRVIENLLINKFGAEGYRLQFDQDPSFSSVYVFEFPYESGKIGKDFTDELNNLLVNWTPLRTKSGEKYGEVTPMADTIRGYFFDWYFWSGSYIYFYAPEGTIAKTPMYSMDNRANSFDEINTSWGSEAFDNSNYTNFLMNVHQDYSSLGSATNRISSLIIYF